MKSLQEQIENRCVHFTGVMNDTCEAGINYADVREGRPYKFPCLKQGGFCLSCQFPSPEEVMAEVDEIQGVGLKTMRVYVKIQEHYRQTKQASGSVKCDCGGELRYSVASVNGHIWAACSKCTLAFGQ